MPPYEGFEFIEFTTSNTDWITTYDWTNTNPLIGLADSGIGNIPSFEVLNDAANSQNAIITVTPTYTNNGVECTGPSETFVLTVNPGAQVNPIDNQILCNDELTDPIQFTTLNTDGVTEYNWTNTNTSIGLRFLRIRYTNTRIWIVNQSSSFHVIAMKRWNCC